MRRLPDWEERLTAVLSDAHSRRFEWGQFDCALFVADCIQAMTGIDISLGLRGTYSDKLGAGLAIRRAGGGNLEMLAAKMAIQYDCPEIPLAMACPGDVALTATEDGTALGLCIGERVLIPTEHEACGLAHDEMENCLRAWRI